MEDSMIDEFLIEAEELFVEGEEALIELEKGGEFTDHFNSLFRAFHSIKGAAGMFALDRLQEHMHYLENLLESKKDSGALSVALIDYLLHGIDCAKKILAGQEVEFDYYDPDADNTDSSESSLETTEEEAILKRNIEDRLAQKDHSGYVYMVDDEEDILSITKLILENGGYKVRTFLEPQKALEAIKTESPDIVITDISMPEMDGIQLMEQLNKIRPHIPVVVLSGFVSKEVCLDALACGVTSILEKPCEPSQLVTVLQYGIDRYRAFKLLRKSIDMLVYQFEDFDRFLEQSGDESKRMMFRQELETLLKQKKVLLEKAK